MNLSDIAGIFQGITTLVQSHPSLLMARLALIALGGLLIFLGRKGILEPLLMIPMGLGMAMVNAGVLFLDPATSAVMARSTGEAVMANGTTPGTLFLAPLVTDTGDLMYILQIDFLQPIYTFAFSNGLIACFVFMGIGVLLDVGFLLARPFQSMFLAMCAELGTVATFPIAVALGFNYNEAASIALVGGADGPMVLFTSLTLAKHLFVPITVVAYLYLGLTYGGYPYLIRFLVPAKLRAIRPVVKPPVRITAGEKLAFAFVAGTMLCLLFPSAAPLLLSLLWAWRYARPACSTSSMSSRTSCSTAPRSSSVCCWGSCARRARSSIPRCCCFWCWASSRCCSRVWAASSGVTFSISPAGGNSIR